MTLGEPGEPLRVGLSHELVELLSSQLYQSPAKAIEELVVNAYDAEAKECRVYIPQDTSDPQFVIVLDNGSGMDREGLTDLWHIGRSKSGAKRWNCGAIENRLGNSVLESWQPTP